MLNHLDISILLITGYSPRKDALVDLLQDVCGNDTRIITISSPLEIKHKITIEPELCLLDLANIKEPALNVIKKVRDHFGNSKIIAVHIYSSQILVDPLFRAGIDGYLAYEPTRSTINKALGCVFSNGTYIPKDILPS